jgi:hypothetical protein
LSRKKKKKGTSAADRKEEGTFGREEEGIVGWDKVFCTKNMREIK